MAITFRDVSAPPLDGFSATAPDGAIIGVTGEDGAGKSTLLRLAAGLSAPARGEVTAAEPRRLLGPLDDLNLGPAATLLVDGTLARHDPIVRARAAIGLERLRRRGAAILIVSHDRELLGELSDEIWWLDAGRLAARGDPRETLDRYIRHVARKLGEWGHHVSEPLAPSFRRGDGRAELTAIETLDAEARPAMVWQSGQPVSVRVRVRFHRAVADPVVGIMIRTRIGFEVYGTNTELEGVRLGPVEAGQTLTVTFAFSCELCPWQYTVTAASHDPDGVWHDWLEDAIAFTVADSRYTAGVANLRARVTVEGR